MSWANNKTDAYETYLARKFYDRNILRKKNITTIDSWDEHKFYGRVNQAGETIMVNESRLQQVRSTDETTMALDFVATAFQEFQTYFSRGLNRGVLTENSQIPNIRPRRAWENPRRLYAEHMRGLFGTFNAVFLDDPRHGNKIENFTDYVASFMIYFEQVGREFPVTLTSFIPSPLCSPFVSGLIIETDKRPYDDDEGKVELVDDTSFAFYKNAAARFGFLVDKNIPWRLTANLSSDKITRYMRKDATVGPLEAFFLKTHLMDMDVVFEYMVNYYNAFVTQNPVKYKLTSKACALGSMSALSGTKYISKRKIVHRRQTLTLGGYERKYGAVYSLKNYFKFRLIEAGLSVDSATTASHIRRILGLYRIDHSNVGLSRALNYIQEHISGTVRSLQPPPEPKTKIKLTTPSNIEITEDYHADEVTDDENIGSFPLPRGSSGGTAFGG
tara:strand:+ start:291 stop:1622 length:1332 start_codon:yes stop_codon:yes gene_type:complete